MKNNINQYQTKMEGIDLLELLFIIWQKKKLVMIITLISVFVTIIISLFITPLYRAYVSLMTLSTNAGIVQLQNIISGIPLGEWSDETKRVVAVLNSRTLIENVVKRLNLDKEEKIKRGNKEKSLLVAVNLLNNNKIVNYDKRTGLITLTVDHENPEKARDIANVYIEELQNILNSKSFSVSRAKREFIEKQLELFEKRIKKQQERLTKFQITSKLIKPNEQIKEVVKLYTELVSKKTALELELKSMESALSPDNPIITRLNSQIKELNYRIQNLVGGKSKGMFPSLKDAPEKIVKYEDIKRDVEITKTIHETMIKLYEQAKIEEAHEGLYIQIIDPAIKPIVKVKPNRRFIVVSSAVLSFAFGILLIFFLRWLEFVRSSYNERK